LLHFNYIVLFGFSVEGQLLLVSLVLCFVYLFLALVIAFFKHLSGSSESLANAPKKSIGIGLKNASYLFICIFTF